MKKNQIKKRLHAIGFVDNPVSGTFFDRNISVKVLGNDIHVYDKGNRLNFLPRINSTEEKLQALQHATGDRLKGAKKVTKGDRLKGAKKVTESNQKSTTVLDSSEGERLKGAKKVDTTTVSLTQFNSDVLKGYEVADNKYIDMSPYTVVSATTQGQGDKVTDPNVYNPQHTPTENGDDYKVDNNTNGNGSGSGNGNGSGSEEEKEEVKSTSALSFFEIIKKYKWVVIGIIVIVLISNNKE